VKLKLIIIGVVVALLAIGSYFVVNTGLLSVYSVVPDGGDTSADKTAADSSRFNDPNQSVQPPIFRTVSEQGNILFLRGTSEPDAVVSILGNSERRRQIRANEDGIWEAEIDVSADGVLALSLTSFLTEDVSFYGDELLIRAIAEKPEPILDDTIISEINSDDLIPAVEPALVLLTAPGGPSRIIQTPFGSLPSRGALTLGAIEYDDLGGVIFSGFSSQSGRVRIYGDDELIGESRVGSNGRWYLIAAETLPLSDYNLRAQLQEASGAETNINVKIRRISPGQNADISPYVVFNDEVWHVRRNLTGGGVQYTAILSPKSLITAEQDGGPTTLP